MSPGLAELSRELNVYVSSDSACFQRKARILQAVWREEQDYPAGKHGNGILGSRLPMPWAKETMANFLTDNIRNVVQADVLGGGDDERLIEPNRLFGNLLGSQPMCFNLFAELALDLDLASRVIARLTDARFPEVKEIRFEYSPGRSDPKYTGDRSAFDVFLLCQTSTGSPAFLGIEVKYHENLQDKPGTHRDRYDEVADMMSCFKPEARDRLREKPLQQIWRDHLLTGAVKDQDGYADAAFVFLYPQDNNYCHEAVGQYLDCLGSADTFLPWTLEDVIGALKQESSAEWIELFEGRYLNFGLLEEVLNGN